MGRKLMPDDTMNFAHSRVFNRREGGIDTGSVSDGLKVQCLLNHQLELAAIQKAKARAYSCAMNVLNAIKDKASTPNPSVPIRANLIKLKR